MILGRRHRADITSKLELIAPSAVRADGSGIELPLPHRPRKATELRLRVVGNRNMAATIIPDKE
jgi:hypothetical protein